MYTYIYVYIYIYGHFIFIYYIRFNIIIRNDKNLVITIRTHCYSRNKPAISLNQTRNVITEIRLTG